MKITIITGGGGGLGSAFLTAIRNRYPGLDEYWIIDIQKEKLEEASKADRRIRPVVMNLSDPESFGFLNDLLENSTADIRILINNAGVETVAPFEKAPEKSLVNTVRVNSEAVMHIDKVCIPFMDHFPENTKCYEVMNTKPREDE